MAGDRVVDVSPDIQFLRHTLATLAYRGGKAVRGAPAAFGAFRPAPGMRTAVEVLAHIGDLLDWTLHLADGRHVWRDAVPLPWEQEAERFFAALAACDARLVAAPLACAPGKIFQGPIADAHTHVGQIAMMRRMAGIPIRGENYYLADIVPGRLGAEQAAARREFD